VGVCLLVDVWVSVCGLVGGCVDYCVCLVCASCLCGWCEFKVCVFLRNESCYLGTKDIPKEQNVFLRNKNSSSGRKCIPEKQNMFLGNMICS